MPRPADLKQLSYKAIVANCARIILRDGGGRAADKPCREELRRRSGQHDIDQAKIRIMQRAAKGLPINVFERRLIAGDLPPGL